MLQQICICLNKQHTHTRMHMYTVKLLSNIDADLIFCAVYHCNAAVSGGGGGTEHQLRLGKAILQIAQTRQHTHTHTHALAVVTVTVTGNGNCNLPPLPVRRTHTHAVQTPAHSAYD